MFVILSIIIRYDMVMKKTTAQFILIAAMTLATVTETAAYGFKVGELNYNYTNDSTAVKVINTSYPDNNYPGLTNVTIPSSIKYNGKTYPVIEIASYAFYNSGVTSVTIPSSVTQFGQRVFQNCSQLTTVTMPNTITSIGEESFMDCPSLTKVTLSGTLTTIDARAFRNCTALTSVTIPSTVKNIGDNAFENCSALTAVTIPAAVEKLQNSWFANCTSLKTVNWNPVECQNAKAPSFINVPANPFSGCPNITTFNIGNQVTRIPDYLCWEMIGLKSLTVPASVNYVGIGAFYNCTSLTTLKWNVKECNDFRINMSACTLPFYQCALTSVTLGNTVEKLPNYLLYGCSGVTEITLPSSLKTIGTLVFHGSGLKKVIIPSTVTSVAAGAFVNCDNLTDVTWDVVEHTNYRQDESPFRMNGYKLTYVKRITLGSHVKKVPAYLFYIQREVTEDVVLPDGLIEVGNYAFFGVPNNTLSLPASLTKVGSYAFNSTKATSLTLPETLTYIGVGAFASCQLTSLYIPASVTYIGSQAFQNSHPETIVVDPANTVYDSRDNCNAIISTSGNMLTKGCDNTVIPATVTSIDSYAFSGYGKPSIAIPASVTSIGGYAFENSALTAVPATSAVTRINERTYFYCNKLKNISIPAAVKDIGVNAFQYCSNLEMVILPDSVAYIRNQAFYDCNQLTAIKALMPHPESISYGTNIVRYPKRVTLYVPAGTLESYQSTSPWKSFKAIEEFTPGELNGDNVLNVSDVSTLYRAILDGGYDVLSDVNNDAVLSVADVSAVYRIILDGE